MLYQLSYIPKKPSLRYKLNISQRNSFFKYISKCFAFFYKKNGKKRRKNLDSALILYYNKSEMTNEILMQLFSESKKMLRMSYAPYSSFKVGAALLCKNGKIFTGCNIENAAYGPSNCAERTAFFKAVSEGFTEFEAILILGGKNGVVKDYCPPCGVCRQVMMEFCDPETFSIFLASSENDIKEYKLKELLPLGFGNKNL